MVQIFQSLLQMYAGLQVYRARSKLEEKTDLKAASTLFDRLLQMDTDEWEAEIKKCAEYVAPAALKSEVQRSMENIVLGLDSGSMAQQVQAEYLRELVARIEKAQNAL